jgi:hypothetical protein
MMNKEPHRAYFYFSNGSHPSMVGGAVEPLNDHTSKVWCNLDQWFQMLVGQSHPNLHIFVKQIIINLETYKTLRNKAYFKRIQLYI